MMMMMMVMVVVVAVISGIVGMLFVGVDNIDTSDKWFNGANSSSGARDGNNSRMSTDVFTEFTDASIDTLLARVLTGFRHITQPTTSNTQHYVDTLIGLT